MAPPASVADRVAALAARFTTAGYPHAFGGEVALAAHAGARPLTGVVLHVFAPSREAAAVLARLAVLGLEVDRSDAADRIAVHGLAALAWGGTPLAIHFGTDGLHALARPRVRRVPFGDRYLYVLSAEDLVLEQVLADAGGGTARSAEIAAALGPDLDAAYLRFALASLGAGEAPPALERWLAG